MLDLSRYFVGNFVSGAGLISNSYWKDIEVEDTASGMFKTKDGKTVTDVYGGDPKSRSWGSQPLVYLGTKVPHHDRTIAIVWGKNSDAKGVTKINQKLPYYIARAGSNDSETWLTENIDLSKLYRRIWPKDDLVRTRIMFVGFTSASTNSPMTAEFGDMVLYR